MPARAATSTGMILPARLLLAIAAGLSIWLAFPGHDHWYAAWLGCGLLSLAGWAARFRTGLLVGFVGGFAYLLPTLSWSGVYVGALPWFALASAESLYVAVMVGVVGALQRRLVHAGRRWAAYVLVPLGWVVQEWARSTTPFGGFPWARLAFSQAESPLAPIAALGGAPLLTAAVASAGLIVHLVIDAVARRGPRRQLAGAVGATAGLIALAALTPVPTGAGAPTARIAYVQGNVPKPGLDFNAERRAVLDNHTRATIELAATGVRPDLVVWPENAADIDPLRNPDAMADIVEAVSAVRAPILLGAVLDEPAPLVSNASLLFRPGSLTPQRYVKQHPVPFAEYIPYRSFFRHFSDKVDLVRAGMAKGTHTGYFELTTATGLRYAVLPTICFEVAYDGLLRTAVTHDPAVPSVLVVQTNNATFGFTDESVQQYAISRIRAIEHGRAVVHVSTVGVSGVISPDGSTTPVTELFTQAYATAEVPVLTGTTLADRIGRAPEYAATGGVFLAWVLGRRRRAADNGEIPEGTGSTKDLVGSTVRTTPCSAPLGPRLHPDL